MHNEALYDKILSLGIIEAVVLFLISFPCSQVALPHATIFGGKAAPGYRNAKLIIKLINVVAEKINGDPDMDSLLKIVFIPNYNVSLAGTLAPLFEQ
jgi:starch phosphorylase